MCLKMCSMLGMVSLFACLCSGTVGAVEGSNYPHHAVLDPDGKFEISWDFTDEQIMFRIVVETLGYVGLGFSPNGGMSGADIVIAGVDDVTGEGYLKDYHAKGEQPPVEDEKQDWEMTWCRQTDTHTEFRIVRNLDTCDQDDRAITTDTVRMIWAYHNNDIVHYHSRNRGTKSMLLLNPQKELPYIPSDSYTVDFVNNKVKVPADDTVYWCEAFSMHAFQQKEHIIKMEPIIQPGNEQLVHHIVLYACPVMTANHTAGQGGVCFGGAMPPDWRLCTYTSMFGWAVGGGTFYLPEHVGYPVGMDDSPNLILLQTHFDNPQRRSDFVDSSGLRFTITRRLRQHDAGSLATGVAVYKTLFIPPYAKDFRTVGHCVPDCTRQGMGNVSEINVFANFPHAHLLGAGVKLRHVRNGKELKPIAVDNHYDFNYQETRVLPEEAKIKPGDHLITECTYNSAHKTSVTFGGESTNEEMCINFMMYYPRMEMANCLSLVDMDALASFAGVSIFKNNFTVDQPEALSGRQFDSVLQKNVDWKNKMNRDRIQDLITSYDTPIQAMCWRERFFEAHGQILKPPKIKTPYMEHSVCRRTSGAMASTPVIRTIYFVLAAIFLLL